jgi:hypothetical protein
MIIIPTTINVLHGFMLGMLANICASAREAAVGAARDAILAQLELQAEFGLIEAEYNSLFRTGRELREYLAEAEVQKERNAAIDALPSAAESWAEANKERQARIDDSLAEFAILVADLPKEKQAALIAAAKKISQISYTAGMDEVQFGHGY